MAMGGGLADSGQQRRPRPVSAPKGSAMAGPGNTKKKKKLRWAHVTSTEVNSALAGLLENIIVVLPESCVQASGIQPNINDKNKPKKLWLGRLRYLRYLLTASMLEEIHNPEEVRRQVLQSAVHTVEAHRMDGSEMSEEVTIAINMARLSDEELTTIARAAVTIQSAWRGARARQGQRVLDVLDDYFSDCVIKGCVLFLCGSTGIAGDSLRYVRMLAGMGYVVLAPDHMASNSDFFSRKDAAVLIHYEDGTDYWVRNLLYEDDRAKGELVYTSSSDRVLGDPEHFDHVYNNVITIRQAGLSLTMRRLPDFMKRHGIFVFGMSEGAVVLSSFNDEMYSDIIRGRVICSYSCEQNYWNYNRPEDAGISGSPLIPTLNIMGYNDEFFGYQDSVAATVARMGEYPMISGNAFDAMVANGVEWGLVAHLEGGRHALTWTHDDVLREILTDFLERPQYVCRQLPYLWSNVKGLQDEITRVRRSADNKVTYVRIRPPAQDDVVAMPNAQKNDEDVTCLLSKLNRRLYQLDHDQPLSPMSDGGALGCFDEIVEMALTPHAEMANSPHSSFSTIEESVRRTISISNVPANSKAAIQVARVMCHVDGPTPSAAVSVPGSVELKQQQSHPSKLARNKSSAADLLREFTHPSGASLSSSGWEAPGMHDLKDDVPDLASEFDDKNERSQLADRSRDSFQSEHLSPGTESPDTTPVKSDPRYTAPSHTVDGFSRPMVQLPKLIINTSLAGQDRSISHMSNPGHRSGLDRTRLGHLHLLERQHSTEMNHPGSSRTSHWVSNSVHSQHHVSPRDTSLAGRVSSAAPTLRPARSSLAEDEDVTPKSLHHPTSSHLGSTVRDLSDIINQQAIASVKACEALTAVADTTRTLAVASAMGSTLTVLALLGFLALEVGRGRK